jgi:hypothetical protein
MARAARVSGLLDKDFDDSWIVPARPRRPRAAPTRRRVAAVAPVDSVEARGAGIDISPEPVFAPEPIVAPEPVFAPHQEPRRANQLSGSSAGIPGRRTITIRGQVARPASRRPPRTVRERTGTRPDRIAMWAVLLGILLVLVAATSSHAAVLHVLAGSLH